MRNLRKTSILFCTLILGLFTACNFSNLIKKNGQVFLDFSGIAKELNSNSRSVIDSVLEPGTNYFIDLKIEGAYKLNTTINLNEQSYYEIDDIPAGSRIKASIEVYKYNMNYYPHTKEILFTGESKPCVISSGENKIEIKLKSKFRITFKIYVRYDPDYQNDNWELEPAYNNGATADTGFYYIQSAIQYIADHPDKKKDWEIVLTGYEANGAFDQAFEFGDNLGYNSAKSIILTSTSNSKAAIKFNSEDRFITVNTRCPIEFNNIMIMPNNGSGNNKILYTEYLSDCNVTLANGTKFEGHNSDTANGFAILINGGSVHMEGTSSISGFYYNNGAAAVNVVYGYFTMAGKSTITNCHGTEGGAVYLTNINNSFSLRENAKITNCSASSNGGAIFVNKGSVNISGGQIANCSANIKGGAIYTEDPSSDMYIYISGGEIKNNQAQCGEAIYLSYENFPAQGQPNKMARLILSENACIDLSNDIFSEKQPVYLSGELTTNKKKIAHITYNSGAGLSPGNSKVIDKYGTNDQSVITNNAFKFYVRVIDDSDDYWVNDSGLIMQFNTNNYLTGDAELRIGDIVFANNKRVHFSSFNNLSKKLYDSIAGMVFYVGSDSGFLGNVNLIVGTETYEGWFEKEGYGTSNEYPRFDVTNITDFISYEDDYYGDEILPNRCSTPLSDISDGSFQGKGIGNTGITETLMTKILSGDFPLYKEVINYGAQEKFSFDGCKYKSNTTSDYTNNWYIPAIEEYKVFAEALESFTFKSYYVTITGSTLTGNYISESMMRKQGLSYPPAYFDSYRGKFYPYYFGINFQTKSITQEVSPYFDYLKNKVVPIHIYVPGN